MTITSRGAVAPTGDRAGTGDGTPAEGAPLDAAALSAIVDEVADHAVTWAKTGAAARADLLQQVITDTMAVEDDWLAAASRTGTTNDASAGATLACPNTQAAILRSRQRRLELVLRVLRSRSASAADNEIPQSRSPAMRST